MPTLPIPTPATWSPRSMPEQQSEEALPEERDMAVVTVVDDSQTENTVHAEAPVSALSTLHGGDDAEVTGRRITANHSEPVRDRFTVCYGTSSNHLACLDNGLRQHPSQLTTKFRRSVRVPTGLGLRFAGRTAMASKDASKATTDKTLTPMSPMGNAQLMAINDSLVTEISLVHREKDALSLQLEKSDRENNFLRTNLRLFSELPASNFRSMVLPHPTSSDSLSTVDETDGQLVRGSDTFSSHKRSPDINQDPDGSATRRARTLRSSALILYRNRATPDEPLAPLGPMGYTQLKETTRNLQSRLFILRREKNALRLQLEKSEREQDCLRGNLQWRMARVRAATVSEMPASNTNTMGPPPLPSSETLFKLDAIDGKFSSGSAKAFSHGQCPHGDLLDSPPTWTHRSSPSSSPDNSLGTSTGFAPIVNLPESDTGWAPRIDRPSSPGQSLVDFSEAMNPHGRSFALGLINPSSSRAGLGNDRRRYASPSFHAGLGGHPSDYTAARASLGCVDLNSFNASSTPRTATRTITAAESGFEGHQLIIDENEGFCGNSIGHDQKAKCERLPDKE